SNPDRVTIQFGGGISGGEFGIQYICSSVWWPTTWDCGAEGQPNCWGAVQGYIPGTPKQGWMRSEFMFNANGNGLCDDGLIGQDYRCVDNWFGGIRHLKDDDDWQNWAQDNQRYGISAKEPMNWFTTIGTHESFNTFAEGYTFPNHVYSISDQLTIGARYIDLRARRIGDYVRLSHTTGSGSTSGGSAGDRAYLYAIEEINKWLSEHPGQVIRLDISVGTADAAAPNPAYLTDPLAKYLGGKILTPAMWCRYLHQYYPAVSRPHGTYAPNCGDIGSFVPYRWPTMDEMRALGKQVIIFTSGGSLGQQYTFDGAVDTGNGMDGSAGCGNGFARQFDATNCLRNGVRYLYNSDATPQERDFYNRAFTTEEEARLVGQAEFDYKSWPGYLVADADDITTIAGATVAPEHANEATAMDGITNCNVSLMKLDMLGADGRFAGGFVGVSGLTDRRNGAIWSWAENDNGTGGGSASCAVLGSDNRWHSRSCTETHQFACAVSRAGDPTTWGDVLQERWAITTASGTWDQGSLICQQEFGTQASPYVFAAPRNGRANQKLIAARSADGLGSSDIWLGYSNTGTRWSTDTPPLAALTATAGGAAYTFGSWTNKEVRLDIGASPTGSDSPIDHVVLTWTTHDFDGKLVVNDSHTFTFPATDPWGTLPSAYGFLDEGVTSITAQATSVDGVVGPKQTVTVKIDKTRPESQLTIGQPQYPHGAERLYVSSQTPFDVTATDVGSGVDHISYRSFPEGGTPASYTSATGHATRFMLAGDDGWYQVDTYATDVATNDEQVHTRYVYLDNSPPVITITQPAATTYTHSSMLTLDYSLADGSGAGVTSYVPKMDGATSLTPLIGGSTHGLQSGQAINLLTTLALGQHTFMIDEATDNVGNVTSKSVTFEIIATPQSIKLDVPQFLAMGAITHRAWSTSLTALLTTAEAQWNRGNCTSAVETYKAFILEVQAQSGKKVNAIAAAIMIADAQYLIAHCA
ncbi:MAG: hypothetical protein M3380_04310, partial [Chloroflexota bacterium]|nr:hypothetical protein [Chloroflexota bacterium]